MKITPFNFNGCDVRTVTLDGEVYFVAKDVAVILGYARPSDAINQHCKGAAFYRPLQTSGGVQDVRLIREPDLYRLVIGSKMPEAVEFEKHVMEVILPSIRKTGSYISHPEALRQLADKIEENERLQLTIEAQRPAVEYVERFVKAEGLFGIRETAKICGLQQNAFVDLCKQRKVLFRENGTLQPYAQWLDAGYFVMKTGEANEYAFKQTRFTSRGIEWVRRYLDLNALLQPALPA